MDKILPTLQPWIQTTFKNMHFKSLTAIQKQAIPILLKGKNLVAISATGSGKTLAFLMPALNTIVFNDDIQILIINPTRELAQQTTQVLNSFVKNAPNLRIVDIAKDNVDDAINKIQSKKPQVVVATPTKLKQIATTQQINFHQLKHCIIDEADMLMDLDFWHEIEEFFEIYDHPQLVKSAWSATLHEQLAIKLKKIFKDTQIIQIGESIYQNKKIHHHIIQTNDNFQTLNSLIAKHFYLCLIFANTKKEVDAIYDFLNEQQVNVIKLHGDLSKRERAKNYKDIKKLKYQFIVASDLASRGMDIDGVSTVISWNIPNTLDWYIHRSGRCGRGKYTGDSYIIHDGSNFKAIDKLMQKHIDFDFYVQKGKNIIPFKPKETNYKKQLFNEEKIKAEINLISNKNSRKVKPNYKKKQKAKIAQIQQKNKVKNKKYYRASKKI